MVTAFITAPPGDAERLAAGLLENHLAACVNRIPCESTYRWQGEVITDSEVIMLAKTSDVRYDALVSYVEERHPHDVPCIERFDEDDIQDAFGEWLVGACETTPV